VVYDSRGANGAGEPLEFDTGVNAVPEAVDMCVRLMTPQEVATARSVSRLAYDGRADRPPVSLPPDSFCICYGSLARVDRHCSCSRMIVRIKVKQGFFSSAEVSRGFGHLL